MHTPAPTPLSNGPAAPNGGGVAAARGRESLRVALRAAGLVQAARIGTCGLALLGDQALGNLADRLRGPDARRRSRTARDARGLRRVVATLGHLKGAFAKAGQFAAVRHDLLPRSATAALASLRDRVPPIRFERIRRLVEVELGESIELLFSEFEPSPIAAGSLAQVHRARLPNGQRVAVKVQYPWLRASLPADLALIRWCLRRWTGRSGAVNADRLLDEFASGLASELDFVHEARIAEEIARNLADDPQVVVPAPVHSHTTPRVLTMTWYAAVPVSDRRRLLELRVDHRSVIQTIARAYAKQVFVDGLFHADPHPGNVLVIDEPTAARNPRVLFIDFGLSRRLAPELRHELRAGIYALMKRDVDAFVDGMERLSMIAPGARPGVRKVVEDMFDQIATAGGALGTSGDRILALKSEAKKLLQRTPGLQLPADLLLYAKTVTYVFALGANIAPDVDVMKLSAPYLLKFLATAD